MHLDLLIWELHNEALRSCNPSPSRVASLRSGPSEISLPSLPPSSDGGDVPIELWRTFLGTSYRSHHPPPFGPTFRPPSPSPSLVERTPFPLIILLLLPLERGVRPFDVVPEEVAEVMFIDGDGEEVDMLQRKARVVVMAKEGFDRSDEATANSGSMVCR
jgi:hypothetical protein